MFSSRAVLMSTTLAVLLGGAFASPAAASSWHHGATEDAYALVQGDHWISSNMSLDAVELLRDRESGSFLWFRRAGRQYRVDDAGVLSQARALFEPLDTLKPERERLAERQSKLDRRENALDREEDVLDRESDRLEEGDEDESPATESDHLALDGRRHDLDERRKSIEAESRALDGVERSLDQREEELEKQAEQKLWKLIDEAVRSGAARPVPPR